MAAVRNGDVAYDLGSGDGRIVIRAAKKFGVRGVGIEMDKTLIEKAGKSAQEKGVSHLVEFRSEDAPESGRFLGDCYHSLHASLVQRSDETQFSEDAKAR